MFSSNFHTPLTSYFILQEQEGDAVGGNDPWRPVRGFVDAFNTRRQQVVTPGDALVVDESMSGWQGAEGDWVVDGLPHVTKIIRKPVPVGCELKCITDGRSGIMMGMEMMEGKERMQAKPHGGGGTGHVIRLTQPWHGSLRTIVADSAFASVKTCSEMLYFGMFFMGIVKTAHSLFPMSFLKNTWCQQGEAVHVHGDQWRGSHTALTTTVKPRGQGEPLPIIALGWADRKLKMFVASRGTTLEGEPARRPRQRIEVIDGRPQTVTYEKVIKRPALVEMFFKFFSSIDIHNRYRQGTLAMEESWKTHTWWHRIVATVFSIIVVDSYFMYRYEYLRRAENAQPMQSFLEFCDVLAAKLIHNQYGYDDDGPARRRRRAQQQEPFDEEVHCLTYLIHILANFILFYLCYITIHRVESFTNIR